MNRLKLLLRTIYVLIKAPYVWEPKGKNFILCSYAANRKTAISEMESFLHAQSDWDKAKAYMYRGKVLYEIPLTNN